MVDGQRASDDGRTTEAAYPISSAAPFSSGEVKSYIMSERYSFYPLEFFPYSQSGVSIDSFYKQTILSK